MNEVIRPKFTMFPPVVKNLLMANVVFFIAMYVLQFNYTVDLSKILGLHYIQSSEFKPYQFITYMFMHANVEHIFFNMFGLWMFGNVLENFWGSKRFIIFYFICGIGAAFTQETSQYFYFQHLHQVIQTFSMSPNQSDFTAIAAKYFGMQASGTESYPGEYVTYLQKGYEELMNVPDVGASGAIFGVLLAFAMYFPNTELYLMFIPIPVKAKYAIAVYGLYELYSGVANRPGDNVAHYAHLGGMLFGFILIMYWKKQYWKGKRLY